MARNPNHHVAIHGHFYQPPRENPWLGVIEEQESATPFHDWNARINSECYQALADSAIVGTDGKVGDIFNCYAHLSFNFGPTLLAFLERKDPATLAQLRTADALAQQTYRGNGAAIAQAYNHIILPLADSADCHTQIIWGLREFEFRFGRKAESIWLSETAINMATVRALIDHGIRFVILSPFQASYFRRFGESEWTGTIDGTIDTRLPYRLFEVDGAGRTHFDRHIDVFFYDKTLSTKVSFEHLLTSADRLEEEMRGRLAEDATLPQIALVATDGEIYGHHEKHANRALAYFFSRSFQSPNLTVSNLSQYLDENSPKCEARLWEGIDGKGSSWSCSHGVGRWERNCGCGGEGSSWNQEWRAPLRVALNNLRDAIREITRRELGGLVFDVRDARNDYIEIILQPDEATREKFLARHAQRMLSDEEKIKLWTLFEAEKFSLLMFTSCGWFFQEISGLEPVQNLRYALRALELCAPWTDRDLLTELENTLANAKSNIAEQGDGRDIFRNQVLPTRYSRQAIAASHVLAKLLDLPTPEYDTTITFTQVKNPRPGILAGAATAFDRWTTATEKLFFIGATNPAAVLFVNSAEEIERALRDKNLTSRLQSEGVPLSALPYADRKRFAAALTRDETAHACSQLQAIYTAVEPLVKQINAWKLPAPASLKSLGEQSLRLRFVELAKEIVKSGKVSAEHRDRADQLRSEAAPLDASLNTPAISLQIAELLAAKINLLKEELTAENADDLLSIVQFAKTLDLSTTSWDYLRGRFWQVLDQTPKKRANAEQIFATLLQVSAEFSLQSAVAVKKCGALLPR